MEIKKQDRIFGLLALAAGIIMLLAVLAVTVFAIRDTSVQCYEVLEADLSEPYTGIISYSDHIYAEFGFGIQHYNVFYAFTKKTASQVEDFFANKGTANATGSRGATEDSRWVYVYKEPVF